MIMQLLDELLEEYKKLPESKRQNIIDILKRPDISGLLVARMQAEEKYDRDSSLNKKINDVFRNIGINDLPLDYRTKQNLRSDPIAPVITVYELKKVLESKIFFNPLGVGKYGQIRVSGSLEVLKNHLALLHQHFPDRLLTEHLLQHQYQEKQELVDKNIADILSYLIELKKQQEDSIYTFTSRSSSPILDDYFNNMNRKFPHPLTDDEKNIRHILTIYSLSEQLMAKDYTLYKNLLISKEKTH